MTDTIEPSVQRPSVCDTHRNDSTSEGEFVPLETIEPAQSRSRLRITAVLLALALSLFIAALDTTIVATAIPTISSDLHSASGYSWIGGAYLLANAAGAPIWAAISDIWGRKPILLVAVAIFGGGSIMCALSNSMQMLIAARALQGVASGGLMQLVNIVISDMFSMRQRSLFFGLLECIWGVAGGVGPVLGGTFAQFVSWRWIFWINIPFSGLAFLLLLLFLDVHHPKTRLYDGIRAIDWFGSLSIIGLTVMVLLGLNFGGSTFPWDSPKVICLIVFGCLMSIVFIYNERWLAKYPLMPLRIVKERSNIMCILVTAAHGFVHVGGEFYLPMYFQSVKEASPVLSGALILPLILSQTVTGIASGILVHRTGRYLEIMWIGSAVLTLGFGLLIHLNSMSPLGQIIGFQIIGGLGSGVLFGTPLIALQAHVSQDDTATATAAGSFLRNLGSSMSVVIGGLVFQTGMNSQAAHMRDAGVSADVVQKFAEGDAGANVQVISTIVDIGHKVAIKEAYAWSLRNLWILYTCIAFLGLVATAFVGKRKLSTEHVETKTGLKAEMVQPTNRT